jgi:purine-binding chemotaxis protein CheW
MKELNNTYLTFEINDTLFAMPVTQIKRVIRAVKVTKVPDSTDKVYGVIDFEGKITPVINLRECLKLPQKEISVSDSFVFLNSKKRLLAIAVDRIKELKEINKLDLSILELPGPGKNMSNTSTTALKNILFYGDKSGVTVIYDVDELVNSEMEIHLEQLLKAYLKNNQAEI